MTRTLRVVAVLGVMAATACACQSDSSGGPGAPASNATTTELLPTSVSELPTFDFDRFEQLMYQLRGTPVVVNLWASWCGPCRKETPSLVNAANRYGDRVQFLGVDYKDGRGAASTFAKDLDVPYPSVFDPSGDIHDRLGFVGLPDTVFYDASGEIVATWPGPLTADALTSHIQQLLASPSP
jgi:thiol-disulfide isomerase/thioredoxin